jgi:hypothetical protein
MDSYEPQAAIMSVPGKPVPLFQPAASASEVIATANADRFLVVEYPYADGQTIHVLTNWRARLAPTK